MRFLEIIRRLICKEKARKLPKMVEDIGEGEITGKVIKVYIEPTVSTETVLKALYFVPNHWKFTIKEWDASKFKELAGDWQSFLLPIEDDEIVIFDGATRKVKYGGGTIAKRVGIAVFGNESDFKLGLRIWHELLHTEKLDADGMMTNPDFLEWLTPEKKSMFHQDAQGHDLFWQLAYYMYLMEELYSKEFYS